MDETFLILSGLYLVPFATILLAWNRNALMAFTIMWVVAMLGFVVAGPFGQERTLAYLPMCVLGTATAFALRRYTLTLEGRHKPLLSWGLIIFCALSVPALLYTAPFWVGAVEQQAQIQ